MNPELIKKCTELAEFCVHMRDDKGIEFGETIKFLSKKLGLTVEETTLAIKVGVEYQLN